MPLLKELPQRGARAPRIQIRVARPQDSTFLAQVILRAGRSHLAKGYWDLAVEDDAYDRLDLIEMLTVLDARSSCHYSGFHVATVNGVLAGAAAGYDPLAEGFMEAGHALAEGFDFLEWSAEQVGSAYSRLEPFTTCLPRFSRGAWVVEWVGVKPAFSGLGVAGQLLAAVVGTGRSRGYRLAQVATYVDNEAAIALYRHLGFAGIEELRHPDFERALGSPGMIRMGRQL
ncbi:MAG: GNAT family N-acetyltransferase [Gemmatimonadales bacterium]